MSLTRNNSILLFLKLIIDQKGKQKSFDVLLLHIVHVWEKAQKLSELETCKHEKIELYNKDCMTQNFLLSGALWIIEYREVDGNFNEIELWRIYLRILDLRQTNQITWKLQCCWRALNNFASSSSLHLFQFSSFLFLRYRFYSETHTHNFPNRLKR